MKKKILVVDDNRVMLKFLTSLLEREGHEVVTAEDGFSAIDILTTYVPDILLIDLIMPRIGGEKLCRIVRRMEHLEDCYVVVVSAAVAEMDFDYTTIGADTCIAKGPFPAMAKNVLTVLEESERPSKQRRLKSNGIMGLDAVYARRMTTELLSRNRHLETILDSIAQGILEVFSDRIVHANQAAALLFGRPLEKLLGASPVALFGPEARTEVEQLMATPPDEAEEPEAFKPIELNGRLVTVRNLPLRGETASSIVIITDITEQKRLELQLQHVQKMEAIGTIASGVAHNFRNTLAGILVNSQVLEMNHADLPDLLEITGRINSSVKRGAELVEGLTQFSRKQTEKGLLDLDLAGVIREVHQLIRDSFDKKIRIGVDTPDTLKIRGDHSGISQVLMNLCTNARDAMPSGGELTIEAGTQGDLARIVVTDTGEGMRPEVLEKCFDPFFTTKEVGKGTGLGLSTTYGIVKGHNGTLRIASEPGKGTRFEIFFPLSRTAAAEEPSPLGGIVKGKGEKILVVDDEKEIQEAMPRLLDLLGYQAVLAENADEAMTLYELFQPDLVLMDRNMPGTDGISCARNIIEHDPGARIAIISGYALEGEPEIGGGGFDFIKGYLTKPIEAEELSRQIRRWLEPEASEA